MTSHTIPEYKKVSVIDPVVNGWLNALPPASGAMALFFIANLMSCGIPEQAAIEIVYKSALFVIANGGKK